MGQRRGAWEQGGQGRRERRGGVPWGRRGRATRKRRRMGNEREDSPTAPSGVWWREVVGESNASTRDAKRLRGGRGTGVTGVGIPHVHKNVPRGNAVLDCGCYISY